MCHMLSLMRNFWRCSKILTEENFGNPDYEFEEGEENDHDESQVNIVEPDPSICSFVSKSHMTNHRTASSSLVLSPNSSSQLPKNQQVCFSTQTTSKFYFHLFLL